MASYTSTGPAGISAEMAFAAVMAAYLIGEKAHPAMPNGACPKRLSLQRRDGPNGFDDIVVEWNRNDDAGVVFIQSKRSIAISDNSTFRKLARSLATYEDEGDWSAAIVATSVSPNLEDIQTILEAARLSSSYVEFDRWWSKPSVLNDAKRKVLKGFSAAAKGLDGEAGWLAMRRLRVIEHDLALLASRDRQAAIEILEKNIETSTDAQATFDSIQTVFLAKAIVSPTYDRASLVRDIPSLAIRPSERNRPAILKIQAESKSAVAAIKDKIKGPDCSITLLRPEYWAKLKQFSDNHQNVRLKGEAGSGKSSLLKRYVESFVGSTLVINERRISGKSWTEVIANLGASISAEETIDTLAASGSCMLAIDGADRLLLDHRRDVVLDLFRAIGASPLKERWSIITSGRDFGQQDTVLSAFSETELEIGEAITIGSLHDKDLAIIASAFPNAGALVARSDLADFNKNPFMLEQLLTSNESPSILTEVELADAWASRGAFVVPAQYHRDAAVAQLASLRLASPDNVPSYGVMDAEGVAALVAEGSVIRQTSSNGIVFAHDVFEDWALSREMARNWHTLPEQLKKAGEPLWWQRTVRLVAQIKLERGRLEEWHHLYLILREDEDLDPAWARLVLIAPLYSERAQELLDKLGTRLMEQEGKLLGELLETLRIFETRINQKLLALQPFAEMSDAEWFRTAAYFGKPVYSSWIAFFRWSLPKWASWPEKHIPALVKLAQIWTNHSQGVSNWVSEHLAKHIEKWLVAVEDYNHLEDGCAYDADRKPPFALNLGFYQWNELESDLQSVLAMCVYSTPDVVEAYLVRLAAQPRLRNARVRLLESPHRLPTHLPVAWANMIKASLLTRERQRRYGIFGPLSNFDSISPFDDAGIREEFRFTASSPHQLGWDQLFAKDSRIALNMMHRLEMRASVFWRMREKRHGGRQPRPLVLKLDNEDIQLWGDASVYRWSRAILGPPSLSSAYLAFDNWLYEQLDNDVKLAELLPRLLQNNGLVATTAPIINAVAHHRNDCNSLSAIAPLLAAPRLWNYDIRRHIDDYNPIHRINCFGSGQHHEVATESIWKRYNKRIPFHHQLLLPFHLMADQTARAFLQEQRARWSLEDLADFDDELENEKWRSKNQETLRRYLSDSDPQSVRLENWADTNQFVARLERPKEGSAELEAQSLEQSRVNSLSGLALWAERSLEAGKIDDTYELQTAIDLLDEIEADGNWKRTDSSGPLYHSASSGVAAVLARFGQSIQIEAQVDWIRDRLLSAISHARPKEEAEFLIPESIMSFDPQTMAAGGVAALATRGFAENLDHTVAELSTHHLHAVGIATLRGFDWEKRPEFAWRCLVAALDICVLDSHMWKSDRCKRRVQRSNIKRRKKAVAFATGNGRNRTPVLPSKRYRARLVRSAKIWPPFIRVRLREQQYIHWKKLEGLLETVPYKKINKTEHGHLFNYFRSLIEWLQFLREEYERRESDVNYYPFESEIIIGKETGRLAAVSANDQAWKTLIDIDQLQSDDLISTYLEAVTHELIVSNRPPDERFWRAWRPAADWVMTNLVPKRRNDSLQNLGYAVRAAGFVCPSPTPLPPDWPHLKMLLPTISSWVRQTKDNAFAANAVLAICERMSLSELEEWFVPWLKLYVEEHKGDASFWMHAGFSDKAAGLLAKLTKSSKPQRSEIRKILSVMADSGSLSAREILPRFAFSRLE